MSDQLLQRESRTLILTSLVLSEQEKDELLAALPNLADDKLSELHTQLVAAAERDREMLAQLPPAELARLKHQVEHIHGTAIATAAAEQSAKDFDAADLLLRDA